MKNSQTTRARQERENWAQQGFGNLPPTFLNWWVRKTPPKTKISRRRLSPIFPLEVLKGWRELPKWLQFIALAAVGVHFILAVLWAYYKYRGW